jgi:hypothetical protein
MSSSGYLSPPPQHQYRSSGNVKCEAGQLLTPLHSTLVRRMTLRDCRPRSISLDSPFEDSNLCESQSHGVHKQRYAVFDNPVSREGDDLKKGLQNLGATNVTALNQLDHSMTARNTCRRFMLRTCTAQKCDYVHDVAFRDTFMETLFGNAWERLWSWPQQDIPDKTFPKDGAAWAIQNDGALKTAGISTKWGQYKPDAILLEPPSTLNLAAGLYIPPSLPATHAQADMNTEIEDKSEVQAGVGSEERPGQDSIAESSSPLRPHRRRRHKLSTVRNRMSVWRRAWRKTAMAKQKTSRSGSEAPLGQGE